MPQTSKPGSTDNLAALHFAILREGVRGIGRLVVLTTILLVLGIAAELPGIQSIWAREPSAFGYAWGFQATLSWVVQAELFAAVVLLAATVWWTSRRREVLLAELEWGRQYGHLGPKSKAVAASAHLATWEIEQARMSRRVVATGLLLSAATFVYFVALVPSNGGGLAVSVLGAGSNLLALGILFGPLMYGLLLEARHSRLDRQFSAGVQELGKREQPATPGDVTKLRTESVRESPQASKSPPIGELVIDLQSTVTDLRRGARRASRLLDVTFWTVLGGFVIAILAVGTISAASETPGVSSIPFGNTGWLEVDFCVLFGFLGVAATMWWIGRALPRALEAVEPHVPESAADRMDPLERSAELVHSGPRILEESRKSHTTAVVIGFLGAAVIAIWSFDVAGNGYQTLVFWGSGAWTAAGPLTAVSLGLLLILVLAPIPLLVGLIASVLIRDETVLVQEARMKSAIGLVSKLEIELWSRF
jgi:hypothetical protein